MGNFIWEYHPRMWVPSVNRIWEYNVLLFQKTLQRNNNDKAARINGNVVTSYLNCVYLGVTGNYIINGTTRNYSVV